MYNQCNAYRAYIFKPSLYLIYPSELQVKDTTDTRMTTADLDIFLNIETDVRLHTNIYDKRPMCCILPVPPSRKVCCYPRR